MDKNQLLKMDPNILLSIINMKLRDVYISLDELCEDMGIEKDLINGKLEAIGYLYNKEINQYK